MPWSLRNYILRLDRLVYVFLSYSFIIPCLCTRSAISSSVGSDEEDLVEETDHSFSSCFFLSWNAGLVSLSNLWRSEMLWTSLATATCLLKQQYICFKNHHFSFSLFFFLVFFTETKCSGSFDYYWKFTGVREIMKKIKFNKYLGCQWHL